MGDLFQPWHILILLFVSAVIFPIKVIPYWVIFKKAGFEPALSILTIIPIVQLIVLCYVAFSDWKLDASRVPPFVPPPLG
jgi:hypothetical protein